MTNRLETTLSSLNANGEKALIPFVTANYPDAERFQRVVSVVVEAGADVLEIGFPHSDPLADGPVIQHSSHLAIQNGFKVEKAFAWIAEFRKEQSLPLVVMCYSNLILRYGAKRFIRRCAESGIDGLIVPDMIIEESGGLRELCEDHGVSFINLVTPTTTPARAIAIARLSSGFVYVVSVTGTTGARANIGNGVETMIKKLKKNCKLPICVGFGISTPEMAGAVSEYCDGVIIGSKILKIVESDDSRAGYPKLREFIDAVKSKMGENK